MSSNNDFEGDVKVKIRKSMKKFEQNPDDTHADLDVIRMATYSQGFLNKQIISILWANGVEVPVFQEMQSKYAKQIKNIFDLDTMALRDDKDRYMLFSSIRHIDYKLFTLGEISGELFKDPFIGPLFKLV